MLLKATSKRGVAAFFLQVFSPRPHIGAAKTKRPMATRSQTIRVSQVVSEPRILYLRCHVLLLIAALLRYDPHTTKSTLQAARSRCGVMFALSVLTACPLTDEGVSISPPAGTPYLSSLQGPGHTKAPRSLQRDLIWCQELWAHASLRQASSAWFIHAAAGRNTPCFLLWDNIPLDRITHVIWPLVICWAFRLFSHFRYSE